jgi:hypothetical protein
MGFRTGAYAKVWEVKAVTETSTKIRISVSRKNKKTGEFEQDFSGFVLCVGTAAAQMATRLTSASRIKLGDCDVTTTYNKEKNITYTNFKLYSFEDVSGDAQTTDDDPAQKKPVDDGEVDLPY